MLDPREGRRGVVLGLTGAGEGVVVPGETADGFRYGREDEVEDERDGGRELRSGDMVIRAGEKAVIEVVSFEKLELWREAQLILFRQRAGMITELSQHIAGKGIT
jgi:hypothetical protein